MSDSGATEFAEGTDEKTGGEAPTPRRPAAGRVEYADVDAAVRNVEEVAAPARDRENRLLRQRIEQLEAQVQALTSVISQLYTDGQLAEGTAPDAESVDRLVARTRECLLDEFAEDRVEVRAHTNEGRLRVVALVDDELSLFEWSEKSVEIENWAREELFDDRDFAVEVQIQMS